MGQHGSASRLKDHYHLQKVKLGEGGFGTVWRAVERKSGELVAVKQVDKACLTTGGIEDQRPAIEREIRLIKALPHKNIVRCLDFFDDSSKMFIVLEYCDGGDFGDKLQERGTTMGESEVAYWMKQMLSAIAFMRSRSVCHRDIKPDNFLVAGGDVLKLADLGLAVKIGEGQSLFERCGTPGFVAPEVAALRSGSRGQQGYSFPVDDWAAGVCMFLVMFGGRHPFHDERGQVDERRLLSGTVEWPSSMLDMIGLGRPRMSQESRQLCQAFLQPEQEKRLRAQEALGSRWFWQAAQHTPSGGDGGSPHLQGREAATSTSGLATSTSGQLGPDRPPCSTAPAALRNAGAAVGRPLSVTILGAKGLRKADWMGHVAGDPYCTCEVVGKPGTVIQTGVVWKSQRPVWNHEAMVSDFALCDALLFTVWDKDYLKHDEVLGRAALPGQKFLATGWKGELDLLEAGEGVNATLQVEITPVRHTE